MLLPILLALISVVVVFVLLAVFARGGAGETSRLLPPRARPPAEPSQSIQTIASVLAKEGMRVDSVDHQPSGNVDVVATNERPLVGMKLYIRLFGEGRSEPVGAIDVQSALDRLKGGGFHKAALISWTGFSDEAKAAAGETAVELIEGHMLETMVGLSSPPTGAPLRETATLHSASNF